MREKRQFRKKGEKLVLGGTEYRLEGVMGCGGSSVVYRASYEDQLNRDSRHDVLIKELYPFHPKGLIYRDENGRICWKEDGAVLMERCRKSFYQGNQANLDLLQKAPEKISGNLNSYEAYGTFYSVLYVHGGKNLEELLLEGKEYRTLKSAAECMKKLLDAVESFHQNNVLHMDISPDNILILPERALLIDYNSVWQIEGEEGIRLLSEKEGYTAPEVRLGEIGDIGPASDLYSVCAIFFRMLTGRPLSEKEMEVGLRRSFPKSLEMFQGEPATAARKAVQILGKGLYVLARKRYQSADELRRELDELIARIDGRGISHSALWESSRQSFQEYRQKRQEDEAYRQRTAVTENGDMLIQEECIRSLETGMCLLMKSPGGMGKTRFLTELWRQSVKDYRPDRPVTVYIPLADYQGSGGEGSYIQKWLLRRLCLKERTETEDGLYQLNRLLDQPEGIRLILLLDGLNEAGSRRKGLLKEIESLGEKPGTGILATDRTDSVLEYGMRSFHKIELLPFCEADVKEELFSRGIRYPEDKRLAELLRNPMMLTLYRRTMEMSEEDGTALKEQVTMESMVGRYLDSLLRHEQRVHSGDYKEQLRCRYILCHFLPEIAADLKRRRRTILTREELYRLTERNYRNLTSKSFGMAFPEFLGKSRLILENIHDEKEWFDYGVAEQLCSHFNLLTESGDGNFRLFHDNFMDYLAEQAEAGRKLCSQYERKEKQKKLLPAAVIATALLAAAAFWISLRPQKLTREQQTALNNSLMQMANHLGVLGSQMDAQKKILKEASQTAILEGEERELENWKEYVELQWKNTEATLLIRGEKKDIGQPLEALGIRVPGETIQDLYERTYEMEGIMTEGLEHLEASLCDENSPYQGRKRREPLIEAYENYLDAYGAYIYLKLNGLLLSVDEEERKEMMDIIAETPVFQDYILKYPLSQVTEEEAKRQTEQAKSLLQEALGEMKRQNYSLPKVQTGYP